MSDFDALRFSFRDSSTEEKLAVLRSASLQGLPVIRGFTEVVSRALEQPEPLEQSEDIAGMLSKVIDTASDLRDLIEVLSFPNNHEEHGRPELRTYECLLDAIRDIAQKLALPLADAIDDPSRIFIHSQYPLVLLDEPRYRREVNFSLVRSGYSVELLSFVENRRFQVEHAISLSALNDVAIVINQWLLEQKTLGDMQMLYPLPSNGS